MPTPLKNPLPRLNAALLSTTGAIPAALHPGSLPVRRETILQFGEGRFLRGFVDWMVHRLNLGGLYDGSVVVVQPIPEGMASVLSEQDGLYTVILRGLQGGALSDERTLVSSISRAIDPHVDFESWISCAANPDLRFVISNTTESGIVCDSEDVFDARPPRSFPAKLTRFLYERFKFFGSASGKGLVMLPCELIEANAVQLKKCVLETVTKWELGRDFENWLHEENLFCNTLVDRIVTGYPTGEAEEMCSALGYEDRLLDTAECFHSWIIEGPEALASELPFTAAGLNVILTDDYTPYRNRKVRILNGAHSALVCYAMPMWLETVRECMEHPEVGPWLERLLFDEIVPAIEDQVDDAAGFARDVLERFRNPFINHKLTSIALNHADKVQVRLAPTAKDFEKKLGRKPPILTALLQS